jgi:Protein of unknown function (DUF1761)
MDINWLAMLVAALVPLAVGALWYSPMLFANAWMKTNGLTEEQLKKGNMALIFGLTFFFSFMLAMILNAVVIHQTHVFSVLMNEPGFNDPNSDVGKFLADFMSKYGQSFRTFKHGALHGTISAVFFALPLIAINALFERRSGRYIAIHAGYWIVTLAVMGGIVSGWQ